ncbi:MAG: hypothetical protein LBH11_05780 [Propionibacteriaceae bacterium]|jgi:hypothetical protein|nr:hypothetical protein [Propionibacteriaceae bacterium]
MSLGPWTPPPEAQLLDSANRELAERYILELLDEQLAVTAAAATESAIDVEAELRIDALRAAFTEAQQIAAARR